MMMENCLGDGPLGISVGDSIDHIHSRGKDHFLGRVCELRELAKLEHSNTRFSLLSGDIEEPAASSSCLCDFPTIMGWVSRNWESNKPFLWSYFITSVRYENNTNTVASWSKGQQVSWLTAHCPVKHKVAQGRGWVVNPCKSVLSTISLEGHGSTINPRWGAKYSLSSHFIL